MSNPAVRVRFAPSPTGPLHVGGARVALFNKLFAMKHGGKLILRIEDTDAGRSAYGFEEKIINALRRLGLDWDEGPEAGGEYGPYRQSEKMSAYQDAAMRLMAAGSAYHCFCSGAELEKSRKEMIARRQAPRYSGKCRELTPAQRAARESEGVKPSVRFFMPTGAIEFDDQVRGPISFQGADLGDFIIVRPDGSATFLLASAVDDMAMEISHVIRGEDHLSNTPLQIMLIGALGGRPPLYGHLPMVLDMDGKKLSKRSAAADVMELMETGHAPEAINTTMAMLGWAGVDGHEPETLEAMAARFGLDRISHSPAHYDQARLESLSAKALRGMEPERFLETIAPVAKSAGLAWNGVSPDLLVRIAQTARDGAHGPVDSVEQMRQFITQPEPDAEAKAALAVPESAIALRELSAALAGIEKLDHDSYQAVIESVSRKTGIKGKKLFMAARAAAAGRVAGPKLADLFIILGPGEIIRRLDATARAYGLK